MLRVQSDLLKCMGRSTQQEIVDEGRVLKRERRQPLWHREHHVRIGHRQHIGLARFEPGRLGAALTLRTVTVPARVVGDPPVSTGVTLLDVTTKTRRATRRDPADDRTLLTAPGRTCAEWLRAQVPSEDLRDLVPRSLGHLLGGDQLLAQRIQWTSRPAQTLRRHMCVDLSRSQRAVTQQRLDHPQVRARLHQVRRVTVPIIPNSE